MRVVERVRIGTTWTVSVLREPLRADIVMLHRTYRDQECSLALLVWEGSGRWDAVDRSVDIPARVRKVAERLHQQYVVLGATGP